MRTLAVIISDPVVPHQRLINGFISDADFHLKLPFNRFPLQLQHRSLDILKKNELVDFVFPSHSSHHCIVDLSTKLKLFNQKLQNNLEQCPAIQHIVSGISRPAPYLLFGPPGTGKTTTLVEAIKQVLQCHPCPHAVVCAMSNNSASLLCEQLLPHVDEAHMLRFLAASHHLTNIPESIRLVLAGDP
uniref:putative helicase MOV-10 isoform X2 n=1 Tax=Myxine glutinosa TaxID=7769 RepID=UPI00358F370E